MHIITFINYGIVVAHEITSDTVTMMKQSTDKTPVPDADQLLPPSVSEEISEPVAEEDSDDSIESLFDHATDTSQQLDCASSCRLAALQMGLPEELLRNIHTFTSKKEFKVVYDSAITDLSLATVLSERRNVCIVCVVNDSLIIGSYHHQVIHLNVRCTGDDKHCIFQQLPNCGHWRLRDASTESLIVRSRNGREVVEVPHYYSVGADGTLEMRGDTRDYYFITTSVIPERLIGTAQSRRLFVIQCK